MSLQDAKPQVLSEVADKMIPSLILIFDGLKRAYAARAAEGEEEESEDEDEDCEGDVDELRIFYWLLTVKLSDLFVDGLSSDEDDIDELGPSYYDRVADMTQSKANESGFEISAEIKVRL